MKDALNNINEMLTNTYKAFGKFIYSSVELLLWLAGVIFIGVAFLTIPLWIIPYIIIKRGGKR